MSRPRSKRSHVSDPVTIVTMHSVESVFRVRQLPSEKKHSNSPAPLPETGRRREGGKVGEGSHLFLSGEDSLSYTESWRSCAMMSLHSRSGGDLLRAAPGTLPERLPVIPGASRRSFSKNAQEKLYSSGPLASVPVPLRHRNAAAASRKFGRKEIQSNSAENKMIAQPVL